jgi:hypothetical protein
MLISATMLKRCFISTRLRGLAAFVESNLYIHTQASQFPNYPISATFNAAPLASFVEAAPQLYLRRARFLGVSRGAQRGRLSRTGD